MPYATDADLLVRVPAAASLSVSARAAALLDAEAMISLSVYGSQALLAHAMYAAHLLSCRYPTTLGGEAGAPTSLSAGEISAGWASATTTAAEGSPGATSYGRRFLEVERRVAHPLEVSC